MRSLVVMWVAVFLVSCSGRSPDPGPGPAPGPGGGWAADLRQSTDLGGEEVRESRDGPWIVRAAGSAAADGAEWSGAPSADGAMRLGMAEGEAPAPGAPPTGGVALGGDAGSATGDADEAPFPGPPTRDAQGGGRLRAGATDDNEDLEGFVKFLAEWGDRPETAANHDPLDVRDRRFVRVVNREGKPVPAAEVRITDEAADRVVLLGRTYGDGRVPYYPNLAGPPKSPVVAAGAPEGNLVVEVRRDGATARARWDGGSAEFTMTVDVAKPVADPVALDVLLLIDTTGSMADEIERIKESLLSMTQKLRSLGREFDLRYAAVLYRDIGDEYVTKAHPFTSDLPAFDAALKTVMADGGGDTPESLNQGLAEAVGRSDWREGAAKVLFLIADAEPHMDYAGDVRYGESLAAALARGIRIHAVAASGLEGVGSLVFRQIAQFTRGKFIFIEYGRIEESAAAHGVAGAVKSNNLDDILFEQIRDEVARWGR
ncbi:MAG: VWA domain-containing protein [Planctomycetes bacterium]|jgi:hypothetical protein|nr:VWA domain-containing protein [Planctomycetota bacterium]